MPSASRSHARSRWAALSLMLALGALAAIGTGEARTSAQSAVEEITEPALGMATAERGSMNRTLPPAPPGRIPFPVDGGPTCHIYWSSFGQARGSTRTHEGTDIMGIAHQPVYAVVAGELTHRYTNTGTAGWGWTLVDEQTGVIYKYFHLAEDAAGWLTGDRVSVGDVIGYVGDSGTTAGNYHLHFEVRPANVPIQPLDVLDVRNCKVR